MFVKNIIQTEIQIVKKKKKPVLGFILALALG